MCKLEPWRGTPQPGGKCRLLVRPYITPTPCDGAGARSTPWYSCLVLRDRRCCLLDWSECLEVSPSSSARWCGKKRPHLVHAAVLPTSTTRISMTEGLRLLPCYHFITPSSSLPRLRPKKGDNIVAKGVVFASTQKGAQGGVTCRFTRDRTIEKRGRGFADLLRNNLA